MGLKANFGRNDDAAAAWMTSGLYRPSSIVDGCAATPSCGPGSLPVFGLGRGAGAFLLPWPLPGGLAAKMLFLATNHPTA